MLSGTVIILAKIVGGVAGPVRRLQRRAGKRHWWPGTGFGIGDGENVGGFEKVGVE